MAPAIETVMPYSVQPVDIAHLIQVALTPIFLISAIGVTLSVLTSRLARIVDRARDMEDRLTRSDHAGDGRDLHHQLRVMARRARYINSAITLITVAALFISLVVVMLFVNAFLRWDLSAFIAIMFILSMLSLAAALLSFLIEVRIATNSLRIGIDAAAGSEEPAEGA
jgi:CBS domain containing-hemolysin-like protein